MCLLSGFDKEETMFCSDSYQCKMKEIKGELQIDFTGDGFLQGMVRILVGTLVEVGERKRKAESIPAVLESRNREKAGFTAPPQGLILVSVRYEI